MRFEQCRRGRSPLDEASGLNEMPAFAVTKRRISGALKEVRTFLDAAKEKMRRRFPLSAGAFGLEKELIELLPHLGRNLFAHLPGVLASCAHARDDRGLVLGVKGQGLGHAVGIGLCVRA